MSDKKKSPGLKTTINFSEEEAKLLEQLRQEMGARTMAEVVRRSLVQSSALRRQAHDDGTVHIEAPDGKTVVFPMRW